MVDILTPERAYKKKREAEAAYEQAVADAYPVGSPVCFHRGRAFINAEVLLHSHGRLFVRNLDSLAEYWIDAWWVFRGKL
jgi:hypothetical protein